MFYALYCKIILKQTFCKMVNKSDISQDVFCIFIIKNRRQEWEGGAVSPCVCLCFSSSIIYPALPRQQAELLGLWGAATSTELILRISPSALTRCMFKQIPLRFIRSGFISARACLISLAYLHGCSGLFGPMEIRLIVFTMGGVCVCVCVCVRRLMLWNTTGVQVALVGVLQVRTLI